MGDILFSTIEKWQGQKPWGHFLDAGTGAHSLKWILGIQTESWVAITADDMMRRQILADGTVAPAMREQDKILVGNWMDDSFCDSVGMYDTILADYLFGAVDGFSPYTQDLIVLKLKQRLRPGGRIYIVGMNPIPDSAPSPVGAELITQVRRIRDACILLAGHRPYREFPLEWMVRHLQQSGFSLLHTKSYSILHSEDSILRQIRVGQSKLKLFPNESLRAGMEEYLYELTNQAKAAIRNAAQHKIPLSSDYIIAAQLPMTVGDLPLPIPGPSGDGSAVLAPPPPSAL